MLIRETYRQKTRSNLFLIKSLLHFFHASINCLSFIASILSISEEDNWDIPQLSLILYIFFDELEAVDEAGAAASLQKLDLLLELFNLLLIGTGHLLCSGVIEHSHKVLKLSSDKNGVSNSLCAFFQGVEGLASHGTTLVKEKEHRALLGF